jgi:hypothetical protein
VPSIRLNPPRSVGSSITGSIARWPVWRLAVAALAVVFAAACGTAARPVSAGHAPTLGTAAANKLVCQHYLAERDHIKRLANPTLADVERAEADIGANAAQSTGKLPPRPGGHVGRHGSGPSTYGIIEARLPGLHHLKPRRAAPRQLNGWRGVRHWRLIGFTYG